MIADATADEVAELVRPVHGCSLERVASDRGVHRIVIGAGALLAAHGMTLRHVARTWIGLGDMVNDYDALNDVRTRCYTTHGLDPLPASTGIQGGNSTHTPFALDVFAVRGEPIEAISVSGMNEARTYGAAFSRGVQIMGAKRRRVLVSGTASIDPNGRALHAGNFSAQLERMLANASEVLERAHASFMDVAWGVLYIKRRADAAEAVAALERAGLGADVPLPVVVADICRPEWLCEIELWAEIAASTKLQCT